MLLRELANSGIRLPEIGFGTWNYRGGVEPLRAAIECGARLIDTAESYGTEEIVGEAIKGRRHQVFLATKVLPRNFRRRDLIAAAERSLRRLGTDHIDLYQLHWPKPRNSDRRADARDGGTRRCWQSPVHRSQQFLRARPGERPSGPFQATHRSQSGALQPN